MKNSMTRFFAASGVPAGHLQSLDGQVQAPAMNAGDYLFHQGDVAPNLYLIGQGLAKMFYVTHDGKEFVKPFLPEGSFAGSLVAQLEGRPSPFSAVCLEAVGAEVVPFSALETLFKKSPEARSFGLRFFQELALKKEKREYELLCLPPAQRYRAFIEENPGLAARVKQKDIAHYLGITPIALSRIRRRMKTPGPA